MGQQALPKVWNTGLWKTTFLILLWRVMGKLKLLGERCFADKLAGRHHSTLKQGILSLHNLCVFPWKYLCVREFLVNLPLYPPNSLNLYKSYFSILSSFCVSPGLYPRLANRKGHVPTCTTECFQLPEIFIGNTELSLISWQYIVKWYTYKSNRNDSIMSIQQLDLS